MDCVVNLTTAQISAIFNGVPIDPDQHGMSGRIKIPVKTLTIIPVFRYYSGEADEDQRKVLKGMTEVAKEKETGALNESAESIKVIILLDFVLLLID